MDKQLTPEEIVDIIEESMFDCYPQWRNLTPSDLPIVAEKIASLINTEPEDECICCSRVDDYMVTPNPDCPLHGGLHGKNPYKED